jgi:hypothetical protein
VGIAAGVQEKFDFKAVAMAGVTAGVAAGLGSAGGGFAKIGLKGSSFWTQAAQGAITNAVAQGVGLATGLQSKFDFAGVAAAGLGQASGRNGLRGFAGRALANAADAVASAVTRTVLTGTSFGDNLIAVLPDVIGRTVGGAVGDALGGKIKHAGAANTRSGTVTKSAGPWTTKRLQFAAVQSNVATDATPSGVTAGSYSALSASNVTNLIAAGFGDQRIAAVDATLAAQAAANQASPSAPLSGSRRRALLRLIAPNDNAYDQLTKLPVRLQRAVLDTDGEIIAVRRQIANATISPDETTMTNISLNEREYTIAVHLDVWNMLRGPDEDNSGTSNVGVTFSNQSQQAAPVQTALQLAQQRYEAAKAAGQSIPDIAARADVRGFAARIADITHRAELKGDDNFERVVHFGRNGANEVVVNTIHTLGELGGTFSTSNRTEAVLHVHQLDLNPQPYIGDGSSAWRARPVPNFTVGRQQNGQILVTEIGRENERTVWRTLDAQGNVANTQNVKWQGWR